MEAGVGGGRGQTCTETGVCKRLATLCGGVGGGDEVGTRDTRVAEEVRAVGGTGGGGRA